MQHGSFSADDATPRPFSLSTLVRSVNWPTLLSGLTLGLVTLHVCSIQPLTEQVQQLQGQLGMMRSDVSRLAAAASDVQQAGNLLAAINEQQAHVMAARQTGFAMLFGGSVQEAMDMALVAHASTLAARVPFMNIFDGFRTSHEIAKVERLGVDDVRALIDQRLVEAHRARALTPERPVMRGTAQNPDVFFQAREAVNPYYRACPEIVADMMDRLAERVGRRYRPFEYFGAQYGLEVRGLQGISTASEYGLNDVTQMVDMLTQRKIRAVFVESSVPKRAINAVVEGCQSRGHDIVIGGELFSDAMGAEGTPEGNYLGMVRHNVNTIVEALK